MKKPDSLASPVGGMPHKRGGGGPRVSAVGAVGSRGLRAQLFAHGADVGVRGIGPSREAAFEQAALALTSILTAPAEVRPEKVVRIECEAPDDGLLLVDWLNALIYRMATDKMLFGRFAVSIDDHRLKARAWGEPVDRTRHHPAVEPKGATYTALKVAPNRAGRWVAQCVVDV
jgi:tRNA nucleotidyltransferase (CCA-adding enzyme)